MSGNPGARRDTGARCAPEQQRQACESSHKTHRNPSRAASPQDNHEAISVASNVQNPRPMSMARSWSPLVAK